MILKKFVESRFKLIRILLFRAMFLIVALSFATDLIAEQEHHAGEDIAIGERLFNGLLPLGENAQNCVSCHAYYTSDTLNWNPSVADISLKASLMDSVAFTETLLHPTGNKMAEVHQGYQLDEHQISQLHKYLIHLNETGIKNVPISIDKLLTFGFLLIVFIVAIIDLLITRKIKLKFLHVIALVISFAFMLKMTAHTAIELGRSKNYEPDQPIKFSHKVHAGDNKIDCFYCHSNADEGKSAGIPSANVCMNCHVVVREGSHSGKFEITKLIDHYENNKDIEWIRIHKLPDHVYFNHEQHVKVGKLECKECHGNVEEMDRVRQVKDLSMGWCLDCHKTHKVQFVDNGYYDTYKNYHEAIKRGEMDSVLVSDIGGTDCMKCHY